MDKDGWNMKKKRILFVTFVCILFCFIFIYVEDEGLFVNDNDSIIYEMNEYKQMKERLQQLKEIEKTRSLKEQEIKEFDELYQAIEDYPRFIYSLQALSDNELKNQGYSDSQIEAIRTYDGSKEKTASASMSLCMNMSLQSFYYNASENRTYASVKVSGYWKGKPFMKLKDYVGIGIAGNQARFAMRGTSGFINRIDGSVDTPKETYYSMTGVVFEFDMKDASNHMIKDFELTYHAIADGKVTTMQYGAAYGHTTIALQPSLDITLLGLSNCIGFTSSKGVSIIWQQIKTQTSYI